MEIALARPRLVRPPVTEDRLWYKDAIIYQLHIKSFFDSNNDGIGDFAGLISKLDYIADLGVNTIWLLTTATTSAITAACTPIMARSQMPSASSPRRMHEACG
jgi:pullulanase/glycogen debranching enzyme